VANVCQSCLDDPWLKRVVRDHASGSDCAFCGAIGPEIAAPIEVVVGCIKTCMAGSFQEAAGIPIEGSVTRWYPGTTWSTDELLWDLLGLDIRDRPKLFSALVNGLGSERRWSTADPAVMPEHERLRVSLARFCWRINHEARFFLLSDQRERAALEELGRRCVAFGLIRVLGRCETDSRTLPN